MSSTHPNDQHLRVEAGFTRYSSRRVYRIRVEVHNMRHDENTERDEKSENHVTFALLIGNGQSVRFDMTPNPRTRLGRLVVRGRAETVSRRTIRLTDINALGCPNNFDPDRPPPQQGQGYTVNDFLQYILRFGLHRYRFMYIDSQPLGCRYWITKIMAAFLRAGCMRDDVDFSRGLEGATPLHVLLAGQWDTRVDTPQIVPIAPGLFLPAGQQASLADRNEAYRMLESATLPALLRLANVLEFRSEEAGFERRLQQWQSHNAQRRIQLLQELARTATLEDFEAMAAQDLAGAHRMGFTELEQFLRGRYMRALSAIQLASSQQAHAGDIFVYMLTAVCDMAGPEDES
ncbi:Hypothetical protein R9X50_00408000 [Acrodontium crateriforme]|uniref:DUF7770 domain-containing protein n=1 Tax=Acrodontium crateriforme TaxID=150365 RepID=A0AAQ3RCE7_9PEZI|nr:Hypothetical protein R9X50_00408000 [Acrodontium crateriforme]